MELFGIGFVIALVVIGLLVYMIVRLTAQRDVERTKAENYARQMNEMKDAHALQLKQAKDDFVHQLQQAKDDFAHQLQQTKEAHEQQIAALKEMNEKQIKTQLDLIKEQMQTTSEKVLKMRQEELGAQNKEQVSKIIDPLQRSLKDMQEALDKTKEQQTEALARLDETIKINMQKSAAIGETADRLTRALTGEVKVQGNFGEL